jgi:hypothetical protein
MVFFNLTNKEVIVYTKGNGYKYEGVVIEESVSTIYLTDVFKKKWIIPKENIGVINII